MNSEMFLKIHRETWKRLDLILEQIDRKGLSGLSQQDLKALGILFRRVTAHLAYASANYPGHEMIDHLNGLVVKAHGHIYRSEALVLRSLWGFFSRGFPQFVKGQWRFIFAAGLIFTMGLITGYFLHFFQPALDGLVIPDNIKKTISDNLRRGQVGADWAIAARPVISTMIMTNNIKVGFLAFALGLTWGCGTVQILFYNGLMLGVLAGIFAGEGYSWDFWSLILPHGVLELAAIFICGGAGLILGKALVKPGDYKRRDVLLIQGKIAVKLVVGTIPMFIVAAIIEGFITPSLLPNYCKMLVAAFSFIIFLVYIMLGNRGEGLSRTNYPS